MRSDPTQFELVAPGSLSAVVSLLAERPGEWMPIAGGTDLMVLYAAGKLAAHKLVSVWNLPELRSIGVSETEVSIGAGCTYTDLREHDVVSREFPLLARAARWTGGIANQNRGTLGGNIVNASPAADSLPALLVYDAELILVSTRGERRLPYASFHTGYKRTLLAPDELIRAVILPRRFAGYIFYARKVGARNAQAISKVCVAGVAKMSGGAADDIRIAAGSLASVPIRLRQTEQIVNGKTMDARVIAQARDAARTEVRPIDDIRSTSAYRATVLGNLVAEFLQRLLQGADIANAALSRWNQLSAEPAALEIMSCCGSSAWAHELVAERPFESEESVITASEKIWNHLGAQDWLEAFSRHPRIGEHHAPAAVPAQSAAWSAQEQRDAATVEDQTKAALIEGNRAYESRFGRTFIICASGKSAGEILATLSERLLNDADTELRVAAEEQRKITNLRLKKWLQS